MAGKPILCVGLACLDIVHVVEAFPKEDTDQRSLDQYTVRGGNASNSCTVLKQLGEDCEYFGTLAKDTLESAVMERDFASAGIPISRCVWHKDCICPNSAVIVNVATASRTIIHTNKNLPELTLDDFKSSIRPDDYAWIHFEGRNLENVKRMIAYVKEAAPDVPVSVEVEKIRRNHEELVPFGDVVFLSKDVAMYHGAESQHRALELFKDQLSRGAKLICAWGDQGASAYDGAKDCSFSSLAFPPENGIVDTLGAGDTFNACVIGALSRGLALQTTLELACKVAGNKVGQRGFSGIGELYQKLKAS